ncbi:MAG: ABC transporter ATP-binding protein [Rhodoferax sp.]|nr:ABC transporter ATP-binding protein [Rhodoferax sp.]
MPAIEARGLGKSYQLFERPADRLLQLLLGRWRRSGARWGREFQALREVDLTVYPGEVVGLVGRNGAGKSTLLQLVCGTLAPSTGTLAVRGRVAALLELGGGFSPDFTGLENVHMNAAILGLTRQEVQQRLPEILAFADIGDFIHQPVKTYSSGMFMRLAFAVATSVEPDILVIDEALSVGDGAFARKSFDRIMRLKDAGKTILFCSHSMYQVEALCSRALWIESGRVRLQGPAAAVTSAYAASLEAPAGAGAAPGVLPNTEQTIQTPQGSGRILRVIAEADGVRTDGGPGQALALRSGRSDLLLEVDFAIDPALPAPGVAFGFSDSAGRTVCSAISVNDGVTLRVDAQGRGRARLRFAALPLLKGRYEVTTFLTSEDGLHPYELVMRSLLLEVTQQGLEQGVVSLPHEWLPP